MTPKCRLKFPLSNKRCQLRVNLLGLDVPVSHNIDRFNSLCCSDLYYSLSNSTVGCVLDHRITWKTKKRETMSCHIKANLSAQLVSPFERHNITNMGRMIKFVSCVEKATWLEVFKVWEHPEGGAGVHPECGSGQQRNVIGQGDDIVLSQHSTCPPHPCTWNKKPKVLMQTHDIMHADLMIYFQW